MTMPDDVGAYNRELIASFRANGGQLDGRPLLLLTTVGARSGRLRTSPMMYVRSQDRLLVIASNMGAPKHPAWYHNLVSNPRVRVEMEGDEFDAEASTVTGPERSKTWDWLVGNHPFFAEHQAKTSREIPLVQLVRLA
jgi:deazaflavin-dependent oxidoreductase (nitroreductase family)